MNKKIILFSVVIVTILLFISTGTKMKCKIESAQDAINLFPKTVGDIEKLKRESINIIKNKVDTIIAIPKESRNFANCAKEIDNIINTLNTSAAICGTIKYISPSEELRLQASKALVEIECFYIDYVNSNVALYKSLKEYSESKNFKPESLTQEEKYFISETLKSFEENGLNLPQEQIEKIKALQKDISQISLEFSTNINSDQSCIKVIIDELNGLDSDFINSLKKEDNLYIVSLDYPTYFNVMKNCTISETRKKLWITFVNKAVEKNIAILENLIEKRDKLAKLLQFNSYADLDLNSQMAKDIKTVEDFLNNLLSKANVKAEKEFEELKVNLPDNIKLSKDNKLFPWDIGFIIEKIRNTKYNVSSEEVAKYFPMENTVKKLLNIYESFFKLKFKETPVNNLWDENIKLVEVHKDNKILGYLFLDLYPRPFKYSHACEISIVNPQKNIDGSTCPGVAVVIANFTKPTSNKPSLLKHNEVETFFHEFGHAIHTILGATHMASFAGTNVKRDFVELPSQMLEEWIWDKEIIKYISCHYQTNQPMPNDLIEKIITLKKFGTGLHVQRQIMLSFLSLNLFKDGANKDIKQIYKNLHESIIKQITFNPDDNFFVSFSHLTGYGAKYYGYLWSKVFALDLFSEIKKHGLLNPEIGKKYTSTVIGKGGSRDPNLLLKDFLGREPNQDAFLENLGL